MTAKEIIEELCEIVKNQGDLSVKDLVDIVEGISVEDRIAGKEALTLFYTGESERLINKLVVRYRGQTPQMRLTIVSCDYGV